MELDAGISNQGFQPKLEQDLSGLSGFSKKKLSGFLFDFLGNSMNF